MMDAAKTVFLFDGPIGVGKTTLGKSVAAQLELAFIDRDDHAGPGPWIRSVHRTNHRVLAASITALKDRPGVIVAGPLRCVDWLFYVGHLRQIGVACHCIGLIAQSPHIESRMRSLTPQEQRRSRDMIAQGYGQRPFNLATFRTDQGDIAEITVKCSAYLSALSK